MSKEMGSARKKFNQIFKYIFISIGVLIAILVSYEQFKNKDAAKMANKLCDGISTGSKITYNDFQQRANTLGAKRVFCIGKNSDGSEARCSEICHSQYMNATFVVFGFLRKICSVETKEGVVTKSDLGTID